MFFSNFSHPLRFHVLPRCIWFSSIYNNWIRIIERWSLNWRIFFLILWGQLSSKLKKLHCIIVRIATELWLNPVLVIVWIFRHGGGRRSFTSPFRAIFYSRARGPLDIFGAIWVSPPLLCICRFYCGRVEWFSYIYPKRRPSNRVSGSQTHTERWPASSLFFVGRDLV